MKTERDINDILEDYAFDPSIFNEEPERVAKVKEIINTKLSKADRYIILLYADTLSFRKLGKRLNVSHMTIRKRVLRIINIIKQEYTPNGK